jgi:hypothetical protein
VLDDMSSGTDCSSTDACQNGQVVSVSAPFWSSLLSCVGLLIMTMVHSYLRPLILLDQQLIMGARLSAFPYQDYGEAAFHPASRIEDQSLPWGWCCLPSIWQVGNCAQHQSISYQLLSPIPHIAMVSGERVAPF